MQLDRNGISLYKKLSAGAYCIRLLVIGVHSTRLQNGENNLSFSLPSSVSRYVPKITIGAPLLTPVEQALVAVIGHQLFHTHFTGS